MDAAVGGRTACDRLASRTERETLDRKSACCCTYCVDIRLVYITCKDTDQARSIGQTLVRERLAACTNVLPGMESCYYWQGQLQTDQEAVLIAKTTADRYPLLEKRVKALHSYECPCIVALPVTTGFAPYLDWIRDSTKPGA